MQANNSSILSKHVYEKLKISFERAMYYKKMFLQHSLNMHMLAKELNTNTSYLSRMIAQSFQTNFPTYLNKLRIEEAQKLLGSSEFDDFSIEAISRECGYKSKSTFNKAFKEIVGELPGEYRKRKKQINKSA